MEPLGSGVLLKESGSRGGGGWGVGWGGWALGPYSLVLLPVHSSLPQCGYHVTFQLLVHALKSFLPVVKSLPP